MDEESIPKGIRCDRRSVCTFPHCDCEWDIEIEPFERSDPPVWWEGNSEWPTQEFLTRWMD